MTKSISEIISDLRDLSDDLDRIDMGLDQMEDDGALAGCIECLRLGLPLLEEKYGTSSNEADAARAVIERWSK